MNKKRIVFLLAVVIGIIVIGMFSFRLGGAVSFGKPGVPSVTSILARARTLEEKGNLAEAKSQYSTLISEYPNSKKVAEWENKLGDINIKLIFSGQIIKGSVVYEIKPGDTLAKIARHHGTTVELIKKENNISDSRITPGRKIKVWNTPFGILVDKSQNTLMLKAQEEVIKTYTVSTGKNNCTPTGTFKIVSKQIDPVWFKTEADGTKKVIPAGSPDNALGSRWLGFDLAGYGIHGTTDPQSLGKQVTEGCVRLNNADVEELYIIVPVGTEVNIAD